jgi:hypothetical protein
VGKLIYGAPTWSVEFDDRELAHLRIVITTKLRRGESFSLTWTSDPGTGGGRSSLWLHQAIPLQFVFSGSEEPALNRLWVEALMAKANSSMGLELVPEPQPESRADAK